jgi:hypothetical protein
MVAIDGMTRSKIRYALFRCKAGTPTNEHLNIYSFYLQDVSEYGLDSTDFSIEWDIDKNDFSKIVTGKIVKKYISDLNKLIPKEDILKHKSVKSS